MATSCRRCERKTTWFPCKVPVNKFPTSSRKQVPVRATSSRECERALKTKSRLNFVVMCDWHMEQKIWQEIRTVWQEVAWYSLHTSQAPLAVPAPSQSFQLKTWFHSQFVRCETISPA